MKTRTKTYLVFALVLLTWIGCAAKNPTGARTPENVQVANLSKTLADALRTGNKTIMQLRDSGKIQQAEVVKLQNYMVVAAKCGKATNAELISPDDWPTQKTKIIQIWTNAGLSNAMASLSPEAGVALQTTVMVVNQIMEALGGPAI